MSICKEYYRLTPSGDKSLSFPGAEECPGAIKETDKFSVGEGVTLNINPLYQKWLKTH